MEMLRQGGTRREGVKVHFSGVMDKEPTYDVIMMVAFPMPSTMTVPYTKYEVPSVRNSSDQEANAHKMEPMR